MNHEVLITDENFQAYRRGDERSFMKLYQAFKKPIYAYTIRMVRSPEDAEDLTVRTFARIWENRENIASLAHFKNALYVYARNSAINFLQTKSRSQLELTGDITDEIDAHDISRFNSDQLFTDLIEDIMALVEKMPKLRAKVFRMRYLEERPVQEVAETLGLSVQSVYWHTKEALAQARETLVKKTYAPSRAISLAGLFLLSMFS